MWTAVLRKLVLTVCLTSAVVAEHDGKRNRASDLSLRAWLSDLWFNLLRFSVFRARVSLVSVYEHGFELVIQD